MATKVSGGNTTNYGCDKESSLLSIDYPGTANDDSHEYDGAARRMRSKLNGAGNWTHFVWDEIDGTLLAEYTLISSTFTLTSENTWGLGLISTNRGGTKRYFHFDGKGNTVALTDSSENITDTYGYTRSGEAVGSQDSGTSTNPFRWLGQSGAYFDGAMGSSGGLVRLYSRYIDPSLDQQIIGPKEKDTCLAQLLSTLKGKLRTEKEKIAKDLEKCLAGCRAKQDRERKQCVTNCLSKSVHWKELIPYACCVDNSINGITNPCKGSTDPESNRCCRSRWCTCIFTSGTEWPKYGLPKEWTQYGISCEGDVQASLGCSGWSSDKGYS